MLIMNGNEDKYTYDHELLYDQASLQAYILFACQYEAGGLIDKPGKKPDLFHTNYASAGLSLSQKCTLAGDYNVSLSYDASLELEDINPLFGVPSYKVDNAVKYFAKKQASRLEDDNSISSINKNTEKLTL
jgi:protein farnesyltransferase subunit beta